MIKSNVYAGYDKNILPDSEVKEVVRSQNRIWLVNDNKAGIRQALLPQGHYWYSEEKHKNPLDAENLWWVRRYFNIEDKQSYFGTDIYLLRRK